MKDGNYGAENPDVKGGWDGMVGELVRQVSTPISNYNFKSISVVLHFKGNRACTDGPLHAICLLRFQVFLMDFFCVKSLKTLIFKDFFSRKLIGFNKYLLKFDVLLGVLRC